MSIEHLLEQNHAAHLLSECFVVHPDLSSAVQRFPERTHLLPMSDNALLNIAIGMAIDGAFPVVQLASIESLFATLTLLHQESRHCFALPMLIRVPCLSLDPLIITHLSSLPATVYCAQNQAHAAQIATEAHTRMQPTILLENAPLMKTQQSQSFSGEVEILREGNDVTVIAWGTGVNHVLEVAENVSTQGISLEVLVFHRLFSKSTLVGQSVNKTGRVICVGQSPSLSATLIEQSFWRLEAEPVSCSAEISSIVSAVQDVLLP